MEFIDYTELARTRYTDQFKDNLEFVALVETFTDVLNQYQNGLIDFSNNFLNIDGSSGVGLDAIGVVVGQPRELVRFETKPYFGFEGARNAETYGTLVNPAIGGYWYSINNYEAGSTRILTDEEYRRVIRARIEFNRSDTTRNSLLRVMNYLTNSSTTTVTDLRHGVVSVTLVESESELASYFIDRRRLKDTLIPIPLGTKVIVNYV